jgi:4-carboxymuconolactone decarboxylase
VYLAAPIQPSIFVLKALTAMSDTPSPPRKLPGTYQQIVERFPDLAAAHDQMSEAVDRIGALDAKTAALVKIGISLGAGLESAVRSHVRRAKEAGATEAEIENAIFLGMTTVGFPRTVAAWSWAQTQFARDRNEGTT